jgi:rare lipoprotein A
MRSSVSLLAATLVLAPVFARAQVGAPPELAAGNGPSATAGNGAERYDHVGYAVQADEIAGIAAAHRVLAAGSIAEITALDTGKTILVRIVASDPVDPRAEIALTPAAADLLGVGERAPVRVRTVTASGPDTAALARGEAAAPRIDAPPELLAALRRMLPPAATAPRPGSARRGSGTGAPYARPGAPVAKPAPAIRPLPAAKPTPVQPTPGGLVVQVAAFADQARARAIARTLGGSVQPAAALWRVRLGPFRDRAAAQRARDDAVRRGYAGAQIIPAL